MLHTRRRKKLQITIHSNWIINYFSKNFRSLRKLCSIGLFVNFYPKGFQEFFSEQSIVMSIEKYIARCYWNLGENIVVKVERVGLVESKSCFQKMKVGRQREVI